MSVSLADDVLSLMVSVCGVVKRNCSSMVSVCVVVKRNCSSSVGVFLSVGIKVGFLTRVVGVLLVGDRWVWCVVVGRSDVGNDCSSGVGVGWGCTVIVGD